MPICPSARIRKASWLVGPTLLVSVLVAIIIQLKCTLMLLEYNSTVHYQQYSRLGRERVLEFSRES